MVWNINRFFFLHMLGGIIPTDLDKNAMLTGSDLMGQTNNHQDETRQCYIYIIFMYLIFCLIYLFMISRGKVHQVSGYNFSEYKTPKRCCFWLVTCYFLFLSSGPKKWPDAYCCRRASLKHGDHMPALWLGFPCRLRMAKRDHAGSRWGNRVVGGFLKWGVPNWLVVWLPWIWIFPFLLGMSSSQLTFIFFRGVAQPPTSQK